uniref:DUF5688 family protein n=1 Tax=Agathobacter sp. TaxID=2021311 RepID=UPI00405656AA
MNYQEFIAYIKNSISKRLANGQTVVVEPITKNNGTVYDGMVIIDPCINISPTIYLNPYYSHYLSGVPITDICDTIFAAYEQNLPTKNFDLSLFQDFSKAKTHIIMKLINYEKNVSLLQDIPHIPYLDMAITFACMIADFRNELGTVTIHQKHLQAWGIAKEELYAIAKENTPILLPHLFEHMKNIATNLAELETPLINQVPLYILSNCAKVHGASCILYEDLLDKLAWQLGSDLILIPSSIHEFLVLPSKESAMDADSYNHMIREINKTQLSSDEILSDHIYYYNRNTKELTM